MLDSLETFKQNPRSRLEYHVTTSTDGVGFNIQIQQSRLEKLEKRLVNECATAFRSWLRSEKDGSHTQRRFTCDVSNSCKFERINFVDAIRNQILRPARSEKYSSIEFLSTYDGTTTSITNHEALSLYSCQPQNKSLGKI
jgi:hypothetical protein